MISDSTILMLRDFEKVKNQKYQRLSLCDQNKSESSGSITLFTTFLQLS